MEKKIAGLASLAAAALLATSPAHADGTVKIGLIMTYSGQFADVATMMDNAITEQAQHDQAAQEDQAGNERESQDIGTSSGQVEIEGNSQEPELDAHQEDADCEASKYDGYPARWGRAFNISRALVVKVISITHTHWGTSSTA